jgi:SulP family sulfate permease
MRDVSPYSDVFVAAFDFSAPLRKVVIDVSRAHLWDITSIAALDKVVLKYRRSGVDVAVVGFNEASATMVDRFAVHDKADAGAARVAAR